MEIWKFIPGFDKYEASSFGRIRNKHNYNVLSSNVHRSGYIHNHITDNNNKKVSTASHILVCIAFHGPKPNESYTVDHIDNDKINNKPENLRLASKSDQNKNKVKKENHGGRCNIVEMVDIDSKEIMATFKSAIFASKILDDFNKSKILKEINGIIP